MEGEPVRMNGMSYRTFRQPCPRVACCNEQTAALDAVDEMQIKRLKGVPRHCDFVMIDSLSDRADLGSCSLFNRPDFALAIL